MCVGFPGLGLTTHPPSQPHTPQLGGTSQRTIGADPTAVPPPPFKVEDADMYNFSPPYLTDVILTGTEHERT